MKQMTLAKSCFSLKHVTMPEAYWTKFERGICPFCESNKFLKWNPEGSDYTLVPCRKCMRVYVIPRLKQPTKD